MKLCVQWEDKGEKDIWDFYDEIKAVVSKYRTRFRISLEANEEVGDA
jgi:hypothetical protein